MSLYPEGTPGSIRAGDSLEFAQPATNTIGEDLTVAGGFTCYLVLSNATNNYTVSTVIENDQGFLFQIPYATTSTWVAGEYTASVYADDTTNRYPQSQTTIRVTPELDSAIDARSPARKIRDALEQAILGMATQNQLKMQISGRAIERMDLEQLITAKSTYDGIVDLEERNQAKIDGKNISNTIQVRFVR